MANKPKYINKVETTEMQKRAVENILSGDYQSRPKAFEAAGYTKNSSHNPTRLLRAVGIQKYIDLLDKESKKIFQKKGIEKKIVEVYVAGLGATKLFGKNAIEHPDWLARKAFADRIAPMIGMGTNEPPPVGNQYNFFMFKQQEKEEFNSAFGTFVKDYFKQPRT